MIGIVEVGHKESKMITYRHCRLVLLMVVLVISTTPRAFVRPVQAATLNATAVLDSTQSWRSVQNYLGFNSANDNQCEWKSADVRDAAATLLPRTLRWPPGDISSYWDWQAGSFVSDAVAAQYGDDPTTPAIDGVIVPEYMRNLRDGIDANGDGDTSDPGDTAPAPRCYISDFRAALTTTDAKPVVLLNMLTSDVDTQIALLQELIAIGVDIERIELGNEYYLSGSSTGNQNYIKVYPTGTDYGQTAITWMQAIDTAFPDNDFTYAVQSATRSGPTRQLEWGEQVAIATKDGVALTSLADGFTIHLYYTTTVTRTEEQSTELLLSEVDEVLASPQKKWKDGTQQVINDTTLIPAGKEVWITEYNMADKATDPHGTWLHGLFVASQTLLFLGDSDVQHVMNHTLFGDAVWGAIFTDDRGFDFSEKAGYDAPLPASTPTEYLALTAGGTALREFAATLPVRSAGAAEARKLTFNGLAWQSDSSGYQYPRLMGYAIRLRVGTTFYQPDVYLVNLSADTINLNLADSALNIGSTLCTATHANDKHEGVLTPVTGSSSLSQTTEPVTSSDKTITVPPYSIVSCS
jgi:hypothetical protein